MLFLLNAARKPISKKLTLQITYIQMCTIGMIEMLYSVPSQLTLQHS